MLFIKILLHKVESVITKMAIKRALVATIAFKRFTKILQRYLFRLFCIVWLEHMYIAGVRLFLS